mmetsp:Transcript_65657/g.186294  ORF Transcript_65657/g.186294 Transcript_65657/m.186294 type:complete len:245 (+) Transcript_65657:250-984(+)
MHEAVLEQHLEVDVLAPVHNAPGPEGPQLAQLGHGRPGLEGLHKEARRREERPRQPHVPPRALGEIPAHLLEVPGLEVQARLTGHGLHELLHGRAQVQEARGRHEYVQRPGQPAHQLDVQPEQLHHAGVAHLDRDVLAAPAQHRPVHLGDGAARDGRAPEGGEDLVHGPPQGPLAGAARVAPGVRRHARVQPPQHVAERLREHVRPRGAPLAPLLERWTAASEHPCHKREVEPAADHAKEGQWP